MSFRSMITVKTGKGISKLEKNRRRQRAVAQRSPGSSETVMMPLAWALSGSRPSASSRARTVASARATRAASSISSCTSGTG